MNLFEHIKKHGDDKTFAPTKKSFPPTNERPGSEARVEVYRERLEKGLPLHHSKDLKIKSRKAPEGFQSIYLRMNRANVASDFKNRSLDFCLGKEGGEE